MEKKQYKVCLEVLNKLSQKGVLGHLILIGSWSSYFYKYYFNDNKYIPFIKTRDIDFLVPTPFRLKKKIDIEKVLGSLGFVLDFKGNKGYIRLIHPDLFIEFLVAERGKGIDKPYPLPNLGINAVALRFLDFLSDNTIKVKVKNFYLTLPHPANFVLHKLIIFQRRTREEKAMKDRQAAIEILKALINKNEVNIIRKVFYSVPQKWQKKIIKGLEEAKEDEILKMFLRRKI